MAAAGGKVDGQEKVIAAAQHIVKSLATSANAAEDMIRILSGFDNRLSDLFPSASGSGGAGGDSAGDGEVDDGSDDDDEPLTEKEISLEAAESLVYRWQSSDSLLFEAAPEEVEGYMAAVDNVINLADPDGSPDDASLFDRAETALQAAMVRLEDEFRHLMIRNTVPLDAENIYASASQTTFSFASDAGEAAANSVYSLESPSPPAVPSSDESDPDAAAANVDSDHQIADLVNPDAVVDLQAIANRMILAGYGKELCEVYSGVRRDVLDECLSILGIERISIDEVQRMEWPVLDDKMSKWSQSVKAVVRVLLAGEHRLCNEVFVNPATDRLRDECFAEFTKGCLMQILNFADAVSISRRSSEKLFRILGMYEALADVMSDLRFMFPDEAGEVIISEAEGIMSRLGDAAKGTLNEFGNQVQKEPSRKAILGGEIHPLTRYVMNYVQLIVDYRDSLDALLDDGAADESGNCQESRDCDDTMSPLCRRLFNLISYLESNLEEKAKLYEDSGMHYIFLMNNILYVVQKVRDSELKTLLGENWVRRRRGQVRQYATSYLRASWSKALSFLKDDGLAAGGNGGSAGGASKVALKDRFKGFNMAFEEIYRNQTTWKVPDPQLREELRISISELVIPAYRSFMGRFAGLLEGGKHAAKYIKYTPEDLEGFLLDLFEGFSAGQPSLPRRRNS